MSYETVEQWIQDNLGDGDFTENTIDEVRRVAQERGHGQIVGFIDSTQVPDSSIDNIIKETVEPRVEEVLEEQKEDDLELTQRLGRKTSENGLLEIFEEIQGRPDEQFWKDLINEKAQDLADQGRIELKPGQRLV